MAVGLSMFRMSYRSTGLEEPGHLSQLLENRTLAAVRRTGVEHHCSGDGPGLLRDGYRRHVLHPVPCARLRGDRAMYASAFECTYASFVRMVYQKTFDAILATPCTIEDVIGGRCCEVGRGASSRPPSC